MLRISYFAAPLLICATLHGAEKVSFNRDIRPVFSDTCFQCHGPDEAKRKSGVRFDQRESAVKVAKSGDLPIVPGKPEASEVMNRLTSTDPDELMPPPKLHKKLTPQQIETVRRWIAEGAEYQGHWAFIKPERAAVPPGGRNPIDGFILKKLAEQGLKPSPEAPKETLIRRVTLDLTGLPPTPEEVAAFQKDSAPDAYERVVDRLLKSPRYGEHMAARWLDLARYADSNGSVRLLTNEQGLLTDTYTYDAFGTLLTTTGTTFNRYRYSGEQYDDALGLYYLRARYMNAANGRFWNADSYGGSKSDSASLHKYLYANGDPINRIDPTGMFSIAGLSQAQKISLSIGIGIAAYEGWRTALHGGSGVQVATVEVTTLVLYFSGGRVIGVFRPVVQTVLLKGGVVIGGALAGWRIGSDIEQGHNWWAFSDALEFAGGLMSPRIIRASGDAKPGTGLTPAGTETNPPTIVRVQHATSAPAANTIMSEKLIKSSSRYVYAVEATQPGKVISTQDDILSLGAESAEKVIEFDVLTSQLLKNEVGDVILPSPFPLDGANPTVLDPQ